MFKVGIVGAGYANKVLVPAIKSDGRCEIVAVSARSASSTEKMAAEHSVQGVAGWRDLVANPEIDILVVAVPPPSQPEILIAAAERGKAIFCEKSLGTTSAQSAQLLEIIEDKSLPNAIDFEFMQIDVWKKTRELLNEGKIGSLRGVEISWAVEYAANHPDADGESWKVDVLRGGGVLNNFVSHCFYHIESMFPRIQTMICELGADEKSAHFHIKLTGQINLSLNMYSNTFAGCGHRFNIYGSDGSLSLYNSSADYMKGFILDCRYRDGHKDQFLSDLTTDSVRDGRIPLVASLFSNLIDEIEKSGSFSGPTIKDGDRVERLLDAARVSSENKTWVEV